VKVQIPENDPSDAALWTAILELARISQKWTLVGGQMVRVHANLAGEDPPSATADADAVADVRTESPEALAAIVAALKDMGFHVANGQGRFVKEADPLPLKFDVLIPENVGERAESKAKGVLSTVAVPGSRQAFDRTELVTVMVRNEQGTVPVPNLLGAIILKACAVDLPVKAEPEKHKRDLAFLLSLVKDPIDTASQLNRKDRRRLAKAATLMPQTDPVWSALPRETARRGFAALRLLTSQSHE
jgi:hypothetical protein